MDKLNGSRTFHIRTVHIRTVHIRTVHIVDGSYPDGSYPDDSYLGRFISRTIHIRNRKFFVKKLLYISVIENVLLKNYFRTEIKYQ